MHSVTKLSAVQTKQRNTDIPTMKLLSWNSLIITLRFSGSGIMNYSPAQGINRLVTINLLLKIDVLIVIGYDKVIMLNVLFVCIRCECGK